MITIEILRRIWQLIPVPASPTDKTEAREIESVNLECGHPLLTVDALSQRHLLLPAGPDANSFEDKTSAGVQVTTNEWGEGPHRRRFFDVVCRKPHLNELFDMVVVDILQDSPHVYAHPDQICRKVLSQWRELFEREQGVLPDKTTLIGVFGELCILRELLNSNPTAIKLWAGPTGGRYDFYSGSIALEVKSSIQRHRRIVVIHGHDQLEAPTGGQLYVAVQKLEEVPYAGESLEDLVNNLIQMGCDRVKLWTMLANLQLSPDVVRSCTEIRFKMLERRIYLVDNRFPRITSASFEGGMLPERVLAITYEIDLSSEPPWPVSAQDAAHLLQKMAREATV